MISTLTNAWTARDPWVLDALRDAEVRDGQLIRDSSNYVYLVTLAHPQHGEGLAVYKPARGERPLHDFPYGTLHRREVAAYEFSLLLGWDLVPPTVERDGPEGAGSMQLFIDHDPSEHYFAFREDERHSERLVLVAAFDLMANNADRKGGHLLRDAKGVLWCIDNALCFHQQDKVRTVIWDFSGVPLPQARVDDVERALQALRDADGGTAALRAALSEAELRALIRRCAAMAEDPVLPEMFPYRCVPWPMI